MKTPEPRPAPHEHALIGVVLAVVAFFLFALTSAMSKLVLPAYSVGEMILIRSVVALIILLPFIAREGVRAFRAMPRPGLQFVRVMLNVTEVSMFFWAIGYLPLADIVTIYLSGVLWVTLLSALFLGERVGWRRWSAVAVGFVGVLLALRPSAATVSPPALIALLGTMLYSAGVLVTRTLRGTVDIVLTANQMIAAAILGAVWCLLPGGWKTPNGYDLAILVSLGVPTAIGYVCFNRALKLTAASAVAPFQYTFIVWGALFGYLLFDEIPLTTTLIGAAIIVAAGLYISWRESRLGKPARPVEPV
jgi:drug/metabolite transporter (DMT)-like permease